MNVYLLCHLIFFFKPGSDSKAFVRGASSEVCLWHQTYCVEPEGAYQLWFPGATYRRNVEKCFCGFVLECAMLVPWHVKTALSSTGHLCCAHLTEEPR